MINKKINIEDYNQTVISSKNILKIFVKIPILRVENLSERELIKNVMDTIYSFLNSKTNTYQEIENIKNVIKTINIDNIFQEYLTNYEKDYCENIVKRYLQNTEYYQIPNLENIIDNGEFLKEYILYRIKSIKENEISNRHFTKNLQKIK